jgi:hypothetical protein
MFQFKVDDLNNVTAAILVGKRKTAIFYPDKKEFEKRGILITESEDTFIPYKKLAAQIAYCISQL